MFQKFSGRKKRLASLKGLILRFSAVWDFFLGKKCSRNANDSFQNLGFSDVSSSSQKKLFSSLKGNPLGVLAPYDKKGFGSENAFNEP